MPKVVYLLLFVFAIISRQSGVLINLRPISIYRDVLSHSVSSLPNDGYIEEVTVESNDGFYMIVKTKNGKEYKLQGNLPTGSVWSEVFVRDNVVVSKQFKRGAKEVCNGNLHVDVRTGVISDGSIVISREDSKMTGWVSVVDCNDNRGSGR
jgi:hypothetical protein